MRGLTKFLILLAASSAVTAIAADGNAHTESEIIDLENASCIELMRGDWDALNRVFAEDFTNVSPAGDVSAKVAPFKVTACKIDQMSVRIHNGTAVAVGRMAMTSEYFDGAFRFTDTFILLDGRWRLLASHQSGIQNQAGH